MSAEVKNDLEKRSPSLVKFLEKNSPKKTTDKSVENLAKKDELVEGQTKNMSVSINLEAPKRFLCEEGSKLSAGVIWADWLSEFEVFVAATGITDDKQISLAVCCRSWYQGNL